MEVPPHLFDFTLPLPEFSATRPDLTDFVVGGLVFSKAFPSDPNQEPRVLLLQRSESDSFPGFWEGPGGLCETTDESILAGTAREVLEETGLHVCGVVDLVAVDEWVREKPDRVHRVAKFTFLVEVEEELPSTGLARWEEGVLLQPDEHQAFAWATETEVRDALEAGTGSRYRFVGVQGQNMLTAFRMLKSLMSAT
ncbi:NUDIX hydrolase domain-like protein [Aspergillus ambiguus]|uniref:NUDIX hydrolase n=1 Tax=Aspergillus ambiguus TaxID=176160 RepID=UPI003CCCD7E2